MSEELRMKVEDLRRLKVIEQVNERKVRQKKAGEVLGITARQIRRLAKRVKKQGLKGIIHGGRGKRSNRAYGEEFRERICSLYRKKYFGFGPSLAQEKLIEEEKIEIGRETLRQLLLREGLWETEREGRQHRQWRERKECVGEMVQMDGSHHDWLEGRGPRLVLMGYIDDATGQVFCRFYENEGTFSALESFYYYARCYGLPQSLYLDRHSTYQGWQKLTVEDELAGRERSPSQFGRAMEQLGVKVIAAQSPQAKGRIERLFRTFQDRLVKEMRLAGIATRKEANEFVESYLGKYNQKFRRPAKQRGDLHRPAPGNLKQILSIQASHVLRQDNTIRHENNFYQILNRWSLDRPKEVTVEYRLDGRFYITHKGQKLKFRQIPELVKVSKAKRCVLKLRKPKVPPMSHPYKRKSYERYLLTQQQNRTFLLGRKEDISIGR